MRKSLKRGLTALALTALAGIGVAATAGQANACDEHIQNVVVTMDGHRMINDAPRTITTESSTAKVKLTVVGPHVGNRDAQTAVVNTSITLQPEAGTPSASVNHLGDLTYFAGTEPGGNPKAETTDELTVGAYDVLRDGQPTGGVIIVQPQRGM